MLDADPGAGTAEQVARGAGVVAVVLERIRTPTRARSCAPRSAARCRRRARRAARRRARGRRCRRRPAARRARPAIAGGEVVEDHDALAALDELADDVAADVAGAAGHEDGVRGHSHMLPSLGGPVLGTVFAFFGVEGPLFHRGELFAQVQHVLLPVLGLLEPGNARGNAGSSQRRANQPV